MFEFENYCIDMMHCSVKDNSLGIIAIAPPAKKTTKRMTWV
jgi:hypothetical protein